MAGMPVRHMFIVDMLDIDSMKVLLYIFLGFCIVWLIFYTRFFYLEKKMYANEECNVFDHGHDKGIQCGIGTNQYEKLNLTKNEFERIIGKARFVPFLYPVKILFSKQTKTIYVYLSITFFSENGGRVYYFKRNKNAEWVMFDDMVDW